MAFFKDSSPGSRDTLMAPTDVTPRTPERESHEVARHPKDPLEARQPAASTVRAEAKESFISADLTLEGKIEGAGHVRIAGRFKGDVNVQGDLTIELGAHIAGQVSAKHVIIEGTLEGNISGAERVELRTTGVLTGDVKSGSLIVAAGSRMRGQVEFGWDDASSGAGAKSTIRGVG